MYTYSEICNLIIFIVCSDQTKFAGRGERVNKKNIGLKRGGHQRSSNDFNQTRLVFNFLWAVKCTERIQKTGVRNVGIIHAIRLVNWTWVLLTWTAKSIIRNLYTIVAEETRQGKKEINRWNVISHRGWHPCHFIRVFIFIDGAHTRSPLQHTYTYAHTHTQVWMWMRRMFNLFPPETIKMS